MLYRLMEYQRAMFAPFAAWAASAASAFSDLRSPLSQIPGAPAFAAGYDMLYRLGQTYDKPAFGIAAVEHYGCTIPVVEQVVLKKAFCRLLRFVPDPVALGAAASHPRPAVLICAPLAGHHAVMLREVIETLLPEHIVYVTDWVDARCVPLVDGPFDLDDYVTELQEFIRQIGTAEPLHVIAICQATVPALAAISLLASADEPTPRSLILIGGPIDARRSPTAVGKLAADHSLEWFQRNLIYTVPDRYAGAGRKVCPNFLQLAGLMAAQPDLWWRHTGTTIWNSYGGTTSVPKPSGASAMRIMRCLTWRPSSTWIPSRSCSRNFDWRAAIGSYKASPCVRKTSTLQLC